MSREDGGPAFPTTSEDYQQGFEGMSLRDYRPDDTKPFAEHQAAVARTCYGYADAMLRERER